MQPPFKLRTLNCKAQIRLKFIGQTEGRLENKKSRMCLVHLSPFSLYISPKEVTRSTSAYVTLSLSQFIFFFFIPLVICYVMPSSLFLVAVDKERETAGVLIVTLTFSHSLTNSLSLPFLFLVPLLLCLFSLYLCLSALSIN